MNYKISENGLRFIKREEGLRLKAYKDQAGVLTIGYGHTGPDVYPGLIITESQSTALLLADVEKCERAINRNVSAGKLNQNQVDALCSFIFNVGVGGFESSSALRLLKRLPNNPVVGTLLKLWNKITVGKKKVVAPVLVARRSREVALYFAPV